MIPRPRLDSTIVGLSLILVGGALRSPSQADDMPAPLEPPEALRSFRLPPGFTIQLVASEPLIVDPVAIDFGPDGRLWVCEMHDYPLGLDGNYAPGGRIKVLEDTNGDGQYDAATVFLDGLPFPTGVMAWRDGALICAAPQVIYAEDTNGDGQADRRQVLFEGFGTDNYQARVNSLYLGLDNWLYGASGLKGERITIHGEDKVVEVGSRDFRFRFDGERLDFEPAAGRTQYGRTRDNWNNHFGNTNSSLLQHYPLPEHGVARNPHVAPPAPFVFVPRGADNDRLFPASTTLARYNDLHAANRVTSACSPAIYRDVLFGPAFVGNAFICEPVHNLVTRRVLDDDGVTFAGRRADDEQESEFLASTDNWFRPSQVKTGPDGALYVTDMYRFVIEHPRWISPGQLAKLDVRAGSDRGRIYRIIPRDRIVRSVPRLVDLPTQALATAMETPNGPLRDTIQRLILERKDVAAAAPLAVLVTDSTSPEVRVQSLCTLNGLGALPAELLLKALDDPQPGVRRQAVRIAGERIKEDQRFGSALLRLAEDPEITVRFEVALSLSESEKRDAGHALGLIAMRDADDPWIRAAVLSASTKQPATILATVLDTTRQHGEAPPAELVGPLLATTAAVGDPSDLAGAVTSLATPGIDGAFATWQLAALADLLKSRRVASEPELRSSLTRLLEPAFQAARSRIADAPGDEAGRIAAIDIIGLAEGSEESDLELLMARIEPRESSAVAVAAVKAVDRRGGAQSLERILTRWPELGPSVRAAILETLLARKTGMLALLDAIQQNAITLADLGAGARQRLLMSRDPEILERAREVVAGAQPADRAEVLETYARALDDHQGDPERAVAVFDKHCASCHQFVGRGQPVGPDLAELTDRSTEALLIAILDPNRDVDGRYVAYNAALADGRVINGLIASESGNALTLRSQEGKDEVVLRDELEELRSTGQSLMPEGLEKDLLAGDVADLVTYLATGGARPKSVPGNQPTVITQADDGTIRLPASAAEIHGDTLTFETQFENLGSWESENDRAAWTFEVKRPGIYNVSMDWSCPDEFAGNAFLVRINKGSRRNLVASTGSWSTYESIFIDEESFQPGTHRLELVPVEKPRGALFDIKSVLISPIR